MDISGRLAQANGRLKSSKVGVRIEQHGDRLHLRATLPPKPGSNRPDDYQQRIALGILANPHGLTQAEKEARKVGALLACREFSWEPYLSQERQAETCGDWIAKFEAKIRPQVAEVTWVTDYQRVLDKLPQDKPLTLDLVNQLVDGTRPNSRQRKRFAQTLGMISEFAGLGAGVKERQGNYSSRAVDPRDIPTDEDLVRGFYQIKDPGWRWVYGMLVTYGLRNHEVFFLDSAEFEAGRSPMVRVTEGKTGPHLVWPCFPEWIDEFDLRNKQLPRVTARSHAEYGHRVTNFFARNFKDFTALDIRHRWAIRTLECNWPYEVAASQMGHSVKVHLETYHRWITAEVYQRMFESLMNRSDRPRPPALPGIESSRAGNPPPG